MIAPGSGSAALTGQRAESLGGKLNSRRGGFASGATSPAGTDPESGTTVVPIESCPESPTDSRRVSVLADGGELRGIRIGRGYQSLGCVSQSCFSSPAVCWADAVARALPHPIRATVRNAMTVVERNGATGESERSMKPMSKEENGWPVVRHDLQGRGQMPVLGSPCVGVGHVDRHAIPSDYRLRENRFRLCQQFRGIPVVSRADVSQS